MLLVVFSFGYMKRMSLFRFFAFRLDEVIISSCVIIMCYHHVDRAGGMLGLLEVCKVWFVRPVLLQLIYRDCGGIYAFPNGLHEQKTLILHGVSGCIIRGWKALSHLYFPASGQAVVSGVSAVVPSPPRYVPSVLILHRVQHSHCSSIFIEYC